MKGGVGFLPNNYPTREEEVFLSFENIIRSSLGTHTQSEELLILFVVVVVVENFLGSAHFPNMSKWIEPLKLKGVDDSAIRIRRQINDILTLAFQHTRPCLVLFA
jgi:hypothetical protein